MVQSRSFAISTSLVDPRIRPPKVRVVSRPASRELRSVPLTFVGAMVLGLTESYAVGYLPSDGAFTNFRLAIPTLMLFVALLVIPEVRLRAGSTVRRGGRAPC